MQLVIPCRIFCSKPYDFYMISPHYGVTPGSTTYGETVHTMLHNIWQFLHIRFHNEFWNSCVKFCHYPLILKSMGSFGPFSYYGLHDFGPSECRLGFPVFSTIYIFLKSHEALWHIAG